MTALDKKLVRDFRRLWAQSLAIALVLACGVAVLVLAFGTQRSLFETRSTYYERNRFADVFAAATRVPDSVAAEIAHIPGVLRVETRISTIALLDIEGLNEPASGQLLSLPDNNEPVLNLPTLLEGRWPDAAHPNEVVISQGFANANQFEPSDRFELTLNGQKREVTVAGVALSPEFIYTISPGALMPDDRRYGILWMPERVLKAALDLDGAFNSVTLKLSLEANVEEVKTNLEALLKPYGGSGPIGRDAQISHAFLDSELEQLKVMSQFLPPLFLIISAFLVNMVLGRLIALEREQIGLFKALGYTSAQIGWHYVKLALAIGAAGVALGWVVGWFGTKAMATLYAEFFHFPILLFVERFDTYAISGVAGLGTAALGAVFAVRNVVRLSPAVAMAPPAPPRFKRSFVDRVLIAARTRQTTMMIVRSIVRWPFRALVTVFGIALAGSLMIVSLFMFDAMDELIDASFFRANRQDATLVLTGAKPASVIEEVQDMPGVLRAEGTIGVSTRLHHGSRSRLIGIEGRQHGMDLARVIDPDTDTLVEPDHGLILTDRLAMHLDARVGDLIEVELLQGRGDRFDVPITGIITSYFGLAAYMPREALNALLQQSDRVNQVHVSIDESKTAELYAAVKDTPGVMGITLWTQVRQAFDDTIAESAGIVSTIYVMIGGLIVVGVVYNSARIQLSERARELASLRILGFSRAEVSYILLGEMSLLTLVAIPIGLMVGKGFAAGMIEGLSSDLYQVPLIISRATYLKSAMVVLVAALGSALIVRRRVDRLDLIAVMKTRE